MTANRSIIPSDQAEAPQRRKAILRAAAELFAEKGYDGVSFRNIAERAGVPVGLCTYYFGRKPELYASLFERNRGEIESRIAALRAVSDDPARSSVRSLVDTWVEPVVDLLREPDNAPFGILIARAIWDSSAVSRQTVETFYDPVAFAFLDALGRLLPDRDPSDLVWGYEWSLGALLMHLADVRVTRLSHGRSQPGDPAKAGMLTSFIAGGLMTLPIQPREKEK